jgi:hypothetical protein
VERTVQSAVWNWRDKPDHKPTHLRRQAVLQATVMGAAGAAIKFWWGHDTAGLIVWGLAIVVLFLGLTMPTTYRIVHGFGQRLGHFVGRILGYLLLTPLYFLVFLPGAIILRLQKRDPMHRSPRDINHTCWIERGEEPTADSYQRQFMIEDKVARGNLRPVGESLPIEGGDHS